MLGSTSKVSNKLTYLLRDDSERPLEEEEEEEKQANTVTHLTTL